MSVCKSSQINGRFDHYSDDCNCATLRWRSYTHAGERQMDRARHDVCPIAQRYDDVSQRQSSANLAQPLAICG